MRTIKSNHLRQNTNSHIKIKTFDLSLVPPSFRVEMSTFYRFPSIVIIIMRGGYLAWFYTGIRTARQQPSFAYSHLNFIRIVPIIRPTQISAEHFDGVTIWVYEAKPFFPLNLDYFQGFLWICLLETRSVLAYIHPHRKRVLNLIVTSYSLRTRIVHSYTQRMLNRLKLTHPKFVYIIASWQYRHFKILWTTVFGML